MYALEFPKFEIHYKRFAKKNFKNNVNIQLHF